jgi:hypothetical protein
MGNNSGKTNALKERQAKVGLFNLDGAGREHADTHPYFKRLWSPGIDSKNEFRQPM